MFKDTDIPWNIFLQLNCEIGRIGPIMCGPHDELHFVKRGRGFSIVFT